MSSIDKREGWQAERALHLRKFHFIRGTEALCGRFGFYFGEISTKGMTRSNNEFDCAECRRRVDRELTKREATS